MHQPENWKDLKSAIRAYLNLTGGPSEPLCHRLLKLADFLDDLLEGKDPSDGMLELTGVLVQELGQGVLLRFGALRNRPGMADHLRKLEDHLSGPGPIPATLQQMEQVLSLGKRLEAGSA